MSKPVVVIDRRDWAVLDRFDSPRAAALFYGCTVATVRTACINKHMTVGEYVCFRYEDDCALEDEHPRPREIKPVICTNATGVYKFPDIQTAAKFLNVPAEHIYRSLRTKRDVHGLYVEHMEVAR